MQHFGSIRLNGRYIRRGGKAWESTGPSLALYPEMRNQQARRLESPEHLSRLAKLKP
jgi:hypothetical protein